MPNEIKLYGIIGEDIRAVDVKQQIDAMDQTQPLTVRIHSEGGSVSDGMGIYDAIKAYAGPKKAVIESAAFSIASYIAMAFEDVEITENGYLMIHNPHMEIQGDDAALAHGAGLLAKLKDSMVQAYSKKTGKTTGEVLAIMAAETWVNAAEAVAGGWANRITEPKRQLRAVARTTKMPRGVFESLFGDGSDAGQKREPDKERSMSESTKPVAASLAEIKAAFPKAKAEFVLNCIERQLPMASVMTEALSAMEEELQTVKARLAQYEQQEEQAKSKAMEEEEAAKAKAMEEEDEEEKIEAKAKAKAKIGVKPVAKSASGSSGKPSATAQWTGSVSAKVASGMTRPQAIHAVEREFPGLRQQMIDEANAAR